MKHDPRLHERIRRLIKRGIVEKVIAPRSTEFIGVSIVGMRLCRRDPPLEVLLVAVTRDLACSLTLAEALAALMLCFAFPLPPAGFGMRITKPEEGQELCRCVRQKASSYMAVVTWP